MNKKNVLEQLRIIARIKKDKDLFFDCILKNVGEILKEFKEIKGIVKKQKGLSEICKGDRTRSDKWFSEIRKAKKIEIVHYECSCGTINHYAYDWDTGEFGVLSEEDLKCPKCDKNICPDCKK